MSPAIPCERREEDQGANLSRLAPLREHIRSSLRIARLLLDEVLDSLPASLREVFVLHELEGLSAVEIAETSGVALGTVNSRLRRARTLFALASRRLRARYRLEGSMP